MTVALISLPEPLFDPIAFSARLLDENPITCSKEAIATATAHLHQQFHPEADAGQLLRQRAAFIDALLGCLWDNRDWDGAEVAMIAVGGYGRGELHPHSDIDLLFLLGTKAASCENMLSEFLTLLWDIGLAIGHSVRTVEECVESAQGDITVLTNLMEARVLRGPQELMQSVRDRTATNKMWSSADFFRAKLEEQRGRHAKFADTEYNLEPNVKSSPGGLRDLQIIGWIAERHFGVESLDKLTTRTFLTTEEMDILTRGQEFMWKVEPICGHAINTCNSP